MRRRANLTYSQPLQTARVSDHVVGFGATPYRRANQPAITDDEYAALCGAAKQLGDPQIELFLYLTHEFGHRGKSVLHLHWKDVNLSSGNASSGRMTRRSGSTRRRCCRSTSK